MTLKYYGTDGYASAIDHDLDVAAYLADRVTTDPELELMAPASLSIVCFRFAPADTPRDTTLDDLNKRLLERVQLGGRAFLSSTVLNGRFVLRACIVNPLSSQADIDALLETVKEVGSEVRRSA
jgi:glutamate/tyrosine decarboxylase-like PLP-dependent enzyme